ncbi:type IV secretion system protein [Bartonella sp. CB60]|uniref:type IV secretion system protein n=1 Tax=Bartonella sp. CB60 TaxID=3113619 RepID=UPI00300E386A
MKKLISSIAIAIAIAIVFETPSLAVFVMVPSYDLSKMGRRPAAAPKAAAKPKKVSPQHPMGASLPKQKHAASLPPHTTASLSSKHTESLTQKRAESLAAKQAPKQYAELIDLIKKHLEINTAIKQHLDKNMVEHEKTRIVRAVDDANFFLKHPELIYDKNKNSDILELVEKVRKEESSNSISVERQLIDKRSQNAAIVDKAVSLQTFQEAEKRFDQILILLSEISKTEDLKGIAELQAQIKGRLAMIQNETAKLQMVAHLRNAEQTLISQQKRERNIRMLSSKNTVMPTIRFIR